MAVQTQIQARRGTAATWTSTNPTLAAGETGYETDTGRFKIGTGSTAWASLAYFNRDPLTTKGDLYTFSTTDDRLAVGANGETLVADSSTSTGLRYTAGTVQSNPVLNSSMQIWQRGISISLAASTAYASGFVADRWQTATGANQACTVSREATGDTTNLPFIQYGLRYQRNSGQTGTTALTMQTNFESINSIPFAGKTVTLSFYARKGADYSPTSSNLDAQLYSGTGTDQNANVTGFTGGASVIAQSATLTTTWKRFTYTGTVAATATQLAFWFTWSPTGTAGANDYFDVTGVQIDVGSVALPFRTYAGTIQGELAACQRYYQKSYAAGIAPGASFPGDYGMTIAENNIPDNNYYHYQMLKVTTRTAPTVTIYSATGATGKVTTVAGGDLAAGSGIAALITDDHFTIINASGGALTASSGGFLFFYVASAEL